MDIQPDVWIAYKCAYFFLNSKLSADFFAVITAWNPYSKMTFVEQNRVINNQLVNDILKYKYYDILVGDRKKSWIEESFAVELSVSEAIKLAKKYHQNAIYYVQDGELYLISCRCDQNIEKIGKFSDRVILTD